MLKQTHLTALAALLVSLVAFTGCNSTGGSASAPIQVNKIGDGNMTCEQIIAETNQMNGILGIAEGEMRNAQVLGLTSGIAVNAAAYSGALGNVGYLGSAISAASSLNNMNQQKAEEQAKAAFNRRSVLTGMYAAKGCGQ